MPILAKRVQKLHSSGIRVIAGLADKIPACIKLHIGIPDFFTPASSKALMQVESAPIRTPVKRLSAKLWRKKQINNFD